MQEEKPPLGVKPYWIHSSERILDLCGAIERYTCYSIRIETDFIKRWAKEIVEQCEIIERLREQ